MRTKSHDKARKGLVVARRAMYRPVSLLTVERAVPDSKAAASLHLALLVNEDVVTLKVISDLLQIRCMLDEPLRCCIVSRAKGCS